MNIFKPLWHEGTLLSPQHFQQQGLWEALTKQQLACLTTPFFWGLRQMQLDEEALYTGKLKVEMVNAQLRDGTLIYSERTGDLPAPRDLEADIPEDVNSVDVWLGTPELDPRGNNLQPDSDTVTHEARRYYRRFQSVSDLIGNHSEEIAVEQLSLRLLFGFENRDAFSCIPLIRLQRDRLNRFTIDRYYIPPVLCLSASKSLMSIAQRLEDRLYTKYSRLSEQRHARTQKAADFRVSDVTLFLLLHCINQAWPELRHLNNNPEYHPQLLYLSLIKLAAGLSAFSFEYELSTLPDYDHAHLERIFPLLEERISHLLDIVMATPLVTIELTHPHPTHWYAHLHDPRLKEATDFYLSVRSTLP